MNSQLPRIIAILERDGQIDNFHCMHTRLTLRLGARIFDLKQKGWDFRTEMREDKNTVYVVTKVPEPEQFAISA
jgi:Helix-turn-helix domain